MKKILKNTTTVILSLLLTLNFSCTCFGKSIGKCEAENNTYELEVKQETNYSSNNCLTSRPIMFFTSDGEKGTHEFIVKQALMILKNDKGENVQGLIKKYESTLKEYCDKPDKDEKDFVFAYHFYNPYTGENYLPSFLKQSKITALIKFREHAENAVSNYKTNKDLAMEELGRACHFLEDVNVPYHAANLVAGVSTHSEYEQFVQDNQQHYGINTSDKYNNYSSLAFDNYCNNILNNCAKYAYSFKDNVVNDKNSWNSVADKTVKYAQQYVAAFFYRFLQEVGEI